ncbi:MAG TPA: glycosyltransferase family 39 protein [Bryobacteraceae bacterium]|nr:glycosyltransferase family 39 protein [Bryobacteraceae bacterium]
MIDSRRVFNPLFAVLLAACFVRFWLFLLPESFWIDETVTAFIARFGAGHPSLAAGPRLDQSIYYWLPRASQALFGFSEAALRIPSLAVTFVSLFLIGRMAARLVHPQAGWFAVFLCFIPREFARLATDARPYGLGACVTLAAMWFLIRWLDAGAWRDAALFCLFAALLLRVHLIYWPFYAVFVAYSLMRRVREETPVSARAIMAVFAIVAASLAPLVPVTIGLFKETKVHVVTGMPSFATFKDAMQLPIIIGAGLVFWILATAFRWARERISTTPSDLLLVVSWWLWQPLFLLAISWVTRNPVFVARYFSLALPGMILTAALAAAYSIPSRAWKPLTAALACGILMAGIWRDPFPPSRKSHWRQAALTVNELVRGTDTPVICPSPFVEARPPAWTPSYSLPGFLYAHLAVYPIENTPVLLPGDIIPEGEQYAATIAKNSLSSSTRFVVYGSSVGVTDWGNWFAERPELAAWGHHLVGSFGDVKVALFERGR